MSATTATNGPAKVLAVPPSPEVIDAILKWSVEDRRDLATLLADSIRNEFTSLEEAQQSQKELIHDRIAELVNGAETHDISELFAALDRGVAEARKR